MRDKKYPTLSIEKLLFGFLAAVLSLLIVSCASTRSAGEQMSDAGLTSRVKTRLAADPEVNPLNVDVDSEDGIVTLRGTVNDDATREEIEELTRRTDGVRSVVNDITVGQKSVGERFADSTIVTKVKAKLAADPEINPFNIDVDANRGVVTLSGTVAKKEAKEEAEHLARVTSGVKRVENRIKVESRG